MSPTSRFSMLQRACWEHSSRVNKSTGIISSLVKVCRNVSPSLCDSGGREMEEMKDPDEQASRNRQETYLDPTEYSTLASR